MHHLHATTFAIATASLALAGPLDLTPHCDRFAPRVENITWGLCPGPDTPAQCGRFEVPLDYQNATAGKASLAVGRYPATKQPKLGTLFFNPGGPGGSGIGFILSATAPFVSNVTGGQYDLVSWDPRGVNWTYPRAECFATGTEQKIF
ncbi:hypothetical protein RhiJN_05182 [Ceratobasidium sp. AG-Ba]|nr:hypothetical protein RhiJN_05182 [Ceratobasidium sp. AG-Ba]